MDETFTDQLIEVGVLTGITYVPGTILGFVLAVFLGITEASLNATMLIFVIGPLLASFTAMVVREHYLANT